MRKNAHFNGVASFVEKLREQYKKLKELDSDLFWHLYAFGKRYGEKHWMTRIRRDVLACCIVLGLNGIPITPANISSLDENFTWKGIFNTMRSLVVYRVILPVKVVKGLRSKTRVYSLNPAFKEFLSKPLKELL